MNRIICWTFLLLINPPIQWVSIYSSSSFSSVGRIHRLPITNNSSIIDIVGVLLITFLKLWTKLSKENKETYQRQHFTSVESLRRKSPTYVLLTRFRYKLIVESSTTTPKHMECVISFAERNLPHFFDLFQFFKSTTIHTTSPIWLGLSLSPLILHLTLVSICLPLIWSISPKIKW